MRDECACHWRSWHGQLREQKWRCLEKFSCVVLAVLCKGQGLKSFPKCLRKCMCAHGVRRFDGAARRVFAKSGLKVRTFVLV